MFKLIPDDLDVDFLGKRKIAGAISLVLVLASVVAAIVIGPAYGIDFKGGSDIIIKVDPSVTADDVRDAAESIFPDAGVQQFGEEGSGEFLVQTAEVSVVNSRKIDDVKAVLGNISVTGPAIADNPELQLVEEIETGEQLGLAVKTGNTALLEQVNESLATMEEDGTLDQLKAEWLGTADSEGADSSASPEPAAS